MATTPDVGKNIDAWCTKCKMVLAHTIIAKVGDAPKKVQCNTCGGEHAFKAAQPGTKRTTGRAKSGKGSRGTPEQRAASTFESLIGERDVSSATKYNLKNSFAAGAVIDHPSFGLGVVTGVREGGKIDVTFKGGTRVLVHAR